MYPFVNVRTITPCGIDLLIRWAGCDATDAFLGACHYSTSAQTLLQSFCVGTLEQDETERKGKDFCGAMPLSRDWLIRLLLLALFQRQPRRNQ